MPEFDNPILGLMYWQLKLFVICINRKKFEQTTTAERYWAINNSRNTIPAILFFAIGSLMSVAWITELRKSQGSITTEFIIVFSVVFPLLGVVLFRQLLWLLNGKQELIIEKGNLTLRKRGIFFTKAKVYPLQSIKNIRKAVDETQFSEVEFVQFRMLIFHRVFYRQVFGEILFEYQYNTIRVFNELDEQQKDQLIAELLTWQEKSKTAA